MMMLMIFFIAATAVALLCVLGEKDFRNKALYAVLSYGTAVLAVLCAVIQEVRV